MSIIKWVPDMNDDGMTDLEKWFFGGQGQAQRMPALSPALDMYETDKAVIVEMPIPGFDPEKVDIRVEDDHLVISGETEQKKEVDDKNYLRQEVRYGRLYRSVHLPALVEGEKAQAEYKNGVLRVNVPKAPEVKKKSIKINIAK